MVPVIYHGSCLCDSITFDIEGEPEKVFSCYCLDCAKNSGGPYQLVAKYDVSKITVKDPQNAQAVWIVSQTQSGFEKHKVFCRQCGCTLWTIPMHHQGLKIMVRTSLVNGGLEQWQPQAALFTDCQPRWMRHTLDGKLR
ncbi:Mss4-like protein [Trichoderma sp. SZMC 28015]